MAGSYMFGAGTLTLDAVTVGTQQGGEITIDGEPRGEFVFCAIEVPDQNVNTDPRDLSCPNKFNSVQRTPNRPRSAS